VRVVSSICCRYSDSLTFLPLLVVTEETSNCHCNDNKTTSSTHTITVVHFDNTESK